MIAQTFSGFDNLVGFKSGVLYTLSMVSPPSRAVPIVFGAASTDTEEGRSFYQDRLQLFSGCVFLISGGFYIVDTVMRLIGNRAIAPNLPTASLNHPNIGCIHGSRLRRGAGRGT